jgi:hypothetical protein
MISHSYMSQGTARLLTSIRKLVTYPDFGNDSNGLESLSIATVSKTKTILKTSRVPVMYISNPAYKNPSTLLKHCSAFA